MKQDLTGEYYGVIARIEGPDKVVLFNFESAIREETPFLVLNAGQINRNRRTRGRLRWVKE